MANKTSAETGRDGNSEYQTALIAGHVFIVRCLRPEACYAIFARLDLQVINQLEPLEGSSNKTGIIVLE